MQAGKPDHFQTTALKNSGGMNRLDKLVIVGASGHGKVIADIAKLNGYNDIVFLDDNEAVDECAGYPVINPYAQLGKGCIVNTCASVDHDCNVGDYVHVAVGAHLCGTVEVGAYTWIGAGATVSNNVSICPECMIGAGAVVVKSV